jgi:Na+/melibiose symporter-like transporter
MTLLYKVSQSLAIFLLGILLDLVKFNSSRPVQPEGTVIILGIILGIGMIIGFGFAAMAYSKYDLDKNKVREIQIAIKEKNLEKNRNNKNAGGQGFETS